MCVHLFPMNVCETWQSIRSEAGHESGVEGSLQDWRRGGGSVNSSCWEDSEHPPPQTLRPLQKCFWSLWTRIHLLNHKLSYPTAVKWRTFGLDHFFCLSTQEIWDQNDNEAHAFSPSLQSDELIRTFLHIGAADINFVLARLVQMLMFVSHYSGPAVHQWGQRTALQAVQQHDGGLLVCALHPGHFLHHSGAAVCWEGLLTGLTLPLVSELLDRHQYVRWERAPLWGNVNWIVSSVRPRVHSRYRWVWRD